MHTVAARPTCLVDGVCSQGEGARGRLEKAEFRRLVLSFLRGSCSPGLDSRLIREEGATLIYLQRNVRVVQGRLRVCAFSGLARGSSCANDDLPPDRSHPGRSYAPARADLDRPDRPERRRLRLPAHARSSSRRGGARPQLAESPIRLARHRIRFACLDDPPCDVARASSSALGRLVVVLDLERRGEELARRARAKRRPRPRRRRRREERARVAAAAPWVARRARARAALAHGGRGAAQALAFLVDELLQRHVAQAAAVERRDGAGRRVDADGRARGERREGRVGPGRGRARARGGRREAGRGKGRRAGEVRRGVVTCAVLGKEERRGEAAALQVRNEKRVSDHRVLGNAADKVNGEDAPRQSSRRSPSQGPGPSCCP